MSTLLRARRPFGLSAITLGTDAVLAGVWLPAGSILSAMRGSVNLNGSVELLLSEMTSYGVEAWILPVEDPDSVVSMNALWDSHVPKDVLSFTLDLDADAADATSFYEPGFIAWEFLYDVGLTPQRISHRHKICTPANAALAIIQDTETPFIEHWFPQSVEHFDFRRPIRVSAPSLAVIAVGIPDGLGTDASEAIVALTEDEWGRIKYIDDVLEMAMQHLLGLFEAGAETPWEEASLLLRSYLDPLVQENNAGVFSNTVWNVGGEIVFDVIVPGKMNADILTGGR